MHVLHLIFICSVDLSSMKLQRAVIYVKIVIVLNVKALKQKVCVMFVASMKLWSVIVVIFRWVMCFC